MTEDNVIRQNGHPPGKINAEGSNGPGQTREAAHPI